MRRTSIGSFGLPKLSMRVLRKLKVVAPIHPRWTPQRAHEALAKCGPREDPATAMVSPQRHGCGRMIWSPATDVDVAVACSEKSWLIVRPHSFGRAAAKLVRLRPHEYGRRRDRRGVADLQVHFEDGLSSCRRGQPLAQQCRGKSPPPSDAGADRRARFELCGDRWELHW